MTVIKAEVADDKEHVAVTFDWDPSAVHRIRHIPTRKWVPNPKGAGGYNRLNLDIVVMRRLKEEFDGQLEIGPKLDRWLRRQLKRERIMRRLAISNNAKLENVPNELVWYGAAREKKELRPYQRADIKLMSMRHMVNANQMGAGKTAEVILALAEAELLHGYHLVNAPVASLRLVWEAEIEALYKALGEQPPTILTGDTPHERRDAIAEAVELYSEGYSFWLLLNPAMIRLTEHLSIGGRKLHKREFKDLSAWEQAIVEREKYMDYTELLEIDWTSFTVDEFHLMGLSNTSTQGHKGCKEIVKETNPARCFTLSGTPIRGKPMKLFGALQFLYPKRFSNKWDWAECWLDIDRSEINMGGMTRQTAEVSGIQQAREGEFYDFHKPFLIRRTTRDALPGMPEKNRVNVWCDMSKRQRNQYETFALEAEWRLEEFESRTGKRLKATNILAEYTRLRQFADAYCDVRERLTGDLEVVQTPDSGKLEQLLEKLSEEGVLGDDREPALIYSQFNAMVRMVTDELRAKGLIVEIINGDTVAKGLHTEYAEMFQSGDIDVLVLNTMAGTALNLSRATNVHLLDETWTPDDQEQCEDRAFGGHRAIGKEPGRCYYYRTKASIEEYVMEVVGGKKLNNQIVLDLRKRVHTSLDAKTR